MRLSPEASQVVARIVKVLWGVAEDRKIFALLLDEIASLFDCTRGAVFLHKRASDSLHKVKSLSEGERWDETTLMQFFRNQKPALAADAIMAPVRVGDDVVGVLALGKDAALAEGAGKVATEILRVVGRSLGARRRMMVLVDANRHARALAEGVTPKNVAYRIFHGMRRFIDYDHGATLVAKMDDDTWRVIARQVAWGKGKSDIVGRTLGFAWPRIQDGASTVLHGETCGAPWTPLAALREEASPEKGSSMVAVFTSGERPIGLVELASTRSGFFRQSDVAVVEAYRPCLTLCLSGWYQ